MIFIDSFWTLILLWSFHSFKTTFKLMNFTFWFPLFRHWLFILFLLSAYLSVLFFDPFLFPSVSLFLRSLKPNRRTGRGNIRGTEGKPRVWWGWGFCTYTQLIVPAHSAVKGLVGPTECLLSSWRWYRCLFCIDSVCECDETPSDSHPRRPDDHPSPACERHVVIVL